MYFIPFHTVFVVGVARCGGGVGRGMEWSACGEMTTSSSLPLNNIRHATAMFHNQFDSIQLSPTPTIPNSSLVYQPQQRQRAISSAISQKYFCYVDITTDDIDDVNTDDDTDDDN